jgi:hypothetical protein
MTMTTRVTFHGDGAVSTETVCCACGEAVDRAKAVPDHEETSEEDLRRAEVISHGTGSLEMGACGVRHYHGACYWAEVEAEAAAMDAEDAAPRT